jgi:hypothetical protein
MSPIPHHTAGQTDLSPGPSRDRSPDPFAHDRGSPVVDALVHHIADCDCLVSSVHRVPNTSTFPNSSNSSSPVRMELDGIRVGARDMSDNPKVDASGPLGLGAGNARGHCKMSPETSGLRADDTSSRDKTKCQQQCLGPDIHMFQVLQ